VQLLPERNQPEQRSQPRPGKNLLVLSTGLLFPMADFSFVVYVVVVIVVTVVTVVVAAVFVFYHCIQIYTYMYIFIYIYIYIYIYIIITHALRDPADPPLIDLKEIIGINSLAILVSCVKFCRHFELQGPSFLI
jgi:hypothetical protein